MRDKNLLIFGFGGHARSVADVALSCGYEQLLFVDLNARQGENFLGHKVVKTLEGVDKSWCQAFAASGDGKQRSLQFEEIRAKNLQLVSLISPLASVGAGSSISLGTFVGHHAHVGPMASVGQGCIINTGAIIEHESVVGDFSHVSVNAVMAGRSKLGGFTMLGAGAVVIDGISIVDDVIIGAGAVVISAITTRGTYVGVPARRVGV